MLLCQWITIYDVKDKYTTLRTIINTRINIVPTWILRNSLILAFCTPWPLKFKYWTSIILLQHSYLKTWIFDIMTSIIIIKKTSITKKVHKTDGKWGLFSPQERGIFYISTALQFLPKVKLINFSFLPLVILWE